MRGVACLSITPHSNCQVTMCTRTSTPELVGVGTLSTHSAEPRVSQPPLVTSQTGSNRPLFSAYAGSLRSCFQWANRPEKKILTGNMGLLITDQAFSGRGGICIVVNSGSGVL